MTPLRLGVAGLGRLGALHARMLAGLPGVTLAALYDTDLQRAEAAAREHGAAAAGSLDELLDSVDALTVATPTTDHAATAEAALLRKKHLFIEKPIARTVAEADRICARAREQGCVVQVGHIERFNPAVLAVERYIQDPMFVESHRLAQFNPRGTDVAVVLDLMIHDIDLILAFVRSPVERVDASGIAVVSDTVDIANARLQFENGCVANVTASRISQKKMRKMRLFQRNAYISVDFSDGAAEVFRLLEGDTPDVRGTMMLGQIGEGAKKRTIVYEQPEVKEVNALRHELSLFVEAARTGGPPAVSAEDGRRALAVAGLIMDSISRRRVQL
jgi:predicted dehydrogenase